MRLDELFLLCINAKYIHLKNSADYAVIREGNVLYLFFERSNGEKDWRTNLNFPAKAYKRMGKTVWYAHRGFLRIWKTIEPYLEKQIADKSVQKIIVVGYSHGAAIAVLCHEYVWYHRPDIREHLEGYGFGCPRVLWGSASHDLRRRWEKFLLVRNTNDIVTHLPPAFLGYFHVGKILELGNHAEYSAIDAHREENILKELRRYKK